MLRYLYTATAMAILLAAPAYSQQSTEQPAMLRQAQATEELWSVIMQTSELLCGDRGLECVEVVAEEIGEWALEQRIHQVVIAPIEATVSALRMSQLISSNAGASLVAPDRMDIFATALEDEEFTGSLMERLGTEQVADSLGITVSEIGIDVAFSVITGLTGEVLARHYEANGQTRAAEMTRTLFEPMVEIGTLVAGSGAMSVAGGAATAGLIWAKNVYSFALLGHRMNEDEAAGRDIASVLETVAVQIDDLHRTLLTQRLSGARFGAYQGTPVTPAMAQALEAELSDLYAMQVNLLTSDAAITLAAFRPLTDLAQCLMGRCGGPGVWTGLESAQSTPGLPSDIVLTPAPQIGNIANEAPPPVFGIPSGEWGPDIVGTPNRQIGFNPCANRDLRTCLRDFGLSADAVDFAIGASDTLGFEVFVADHFRELGRVDFVSAAIDIAPYDLNLLVNGDPSIIPLSDFRVNVTGDFTDPASRALIARFPQIALNRTFVAGHRPLPDGQRFVVKTVTTDQCRACPIVAIGIGYLDFDTTGRVRAWRQVGLMSDAAIPAQITSQDIVASPDLLQYQLNLLGYDAGEMDGYPGPQTRTALMEFQVEHCLVPTGQPDQETMAAIVATDGFETPCEGARLPSGITANTPLRSGTYVDDPAMCGVEVLYDTAHLQQRLINGDSTTWGWHGGCSTRRTDIRSGVTLFRGTCYGENTETEASWRFNILSNESFIDLDMFTAIPSDAAPRLYTRCPD